MGYKVYILQSTNNRHYIGYTSDLSQRLSHHNRKHHGYTNSKTEEWEVVISYELETKEEAIELERKLKSFKNYRKVIRYLENLKNIPHLGEVPALF